MAQFTRRYCVQRAAADLRNRLSRQSLPRIFVSVLSDVEIGPNKVMEETSTLPTPGDPESKPTRPLPLSRTMSSKDFLFDTRCSATRSRMKNLRLSSSTSASKALSFQSASAVWATPNLAVQNHIRSWHEKGAGCDSDHLTPCFVPQAISVDITAEKHGHFIIFHE